MSKFISEFKQIDGLDDVFTAQKNHLRCCAVRLSTRGLCLFSPVFGLGDEAVASLSGLGDVEFLLAPNHYHNKGLAEYREAFPRALLCASSDAQPRLEKNTGLRFDDLNRLQGVLPDTMHLVFPQGLKTGEVWVRVVGAKNRAWLVADAFCGPKGKSGNVAGEPEILGTFPKFGVDDRVGYSSWVEQQVQTDAPTMIVPCHGDIVCSTDLATRLKHLVLNDL